MVKLNMSRNKNYCMILDIDYGNSWIQLSNRFEMLLNQLSNDNCAAVLG